MKKGNPIPTNVYKAHVPDFVGRNGELAYQATPITKESCERVSQALINKVERIDRVVFLAHVPKYVTHAGEIVFEPKPRTNPNEDFVIDLENNHWVGVEGNYVVFGTYNGDDEEKTFQSGYIQEMPTDNEVECLGELLAGGIEHGTAQTILRDLQRAKKAAAKKKTDHATDHI